MLFWFFWMLFCIIYTVLSSTLDYWKRTNFLERIYTHQANLYFSFLVVRSLVCIPVCSKNYYLYLTYYLYFTSRFCEIQILLVYEYINVLVTNKILWHIFIFEQNKRGIFSPSFFPLFSCSKIFYRDIYVFSNVEI